MTEVDNGDRQISKREWLKQEITDYALGVLQLPDEEATIVGVIAQRNFDKRFLPDGTPRISRMAITSPEITAE